MNSLEYWVIPLGENKKFVEDSKDLIEKELLLERIIGK